MYVYVYYVYCTSTKVNIVYHVSIDHHIFLFTSIKLLRVALPSYESTFEGTSKVRKYESTFEGTCTHNFGDAQTTSCGDGNPEIFLRSVLLNRMLLVDIPT